MAPYSHPPLFLFLNKVLFWLLSFPSICKSIWFFVILLHLISKWSIRFYLVFIPPPRRLLPTTRNLILLSITLDCYALRRCVCLLTFIRFFFDFQFSVQIKNVILFCRCKWIGYGSVHQQYLIKRLTVVLFHSWLIFSRCLRGFLKINWKFQEKKKARKRTKKKR